MSSDLVTVELSNHWSSRREKGLKPMILGQIGNIGSQRSGCDKGD
jgi:hypothetical protein